MSEFKKKLETLYTNKYFKNISWLFFEKGIRIILGLSLGLWVARYLGPSDFGELSYAQSIVGLAASLAALGLEGIVIREIVRTPEKRGLILGSAFFLKFSATVIAEIILVIMTLMNGAADKSQMLVLIMSCGMIFQSFNIFDFYFKSEVKSKYIVYSNTISLIIISMFRLYFILTKKDVTSFAWAITLDTVFVAGFLYYFYRKLNVQFQWSLSKKMMKELLKGLMAFGP